MGDAAGRVRSFFDARVERVDALSGERSWAQALFDRRVRPAIRERARILLREVARLPAPSLLDIGCGPGGNALAAIRAGARAAVGLDLSPRMIAVARGRSAAAGVADRCRFEVADFTSWPGERRSEIVAALGVLDYVPDGPTFFARLAARAERTLVVSFPRRNARGFARRAWYGLLDCPLFLYREGDVRRWAAAAGFSQIEIAHRSLGCVVMVARRRD